MPTYQKLVRDKIPVLIAAAGKQAIARTLSDGEYRICLTQKLQEEVDEYLLDNSAEELADILEVVYALGELLGIDPTSLEDMRKKKANERGGFKEKIYLISVEK